MASLAGVLAGIPGLAGYAAGQEEDRTAQAAQLQQVGALQGILAKANAERTAAQGRAAAASLSPNASSEEIMAKLRPFVTPEHLVQWTQQADLKKASTEQTKQIAFQNLQQKVATEARHAYEFAQTLPLKERAAATAEINAASSNLMRQGGLLIQANNGAYNTGMDTSPIMDIIARMRSGSMAPTAAAPAAGALPTEDQAMAAAIAKMRRGGTVGTVEYGAGAPPQAQAAPVSQAPAAVPAMPVAAPEQPQAQPAAPSNLDARDLGAGARGPVMGSTPVAAAPVQAPVAPAAPAGKQPGQFTAADAPKGMFGRDASQWARDRNKPSISGGGELTPEAIKMVSEQYRAGDPRALVGFARNQAAKVALTNQIAKDLYAEGGDGKLLAATMAEFEGFRSGQRVIGTREAQLAIAADVTSKFVPIAIEASEKFDRGPYKTLNDVQIAAQSRTASPELRRFAAANNALINVYARAINPQGVATVSDKDHAREILSVAFSKGDYKAGADQLKVEVDTELKSPSSVKSTMRESFTGRRATDRQGVDTSNPLLR